MGNLQGSMRAKTKKASEDFDQALYPAAVDSTGNIVSMVNSASDNNNVNTIVQNKPKKGQAAVCPKAGEEVEFVCGETLQAGDSCVLSGVSGEYMKLKKITIDDEGTYQKRLVVVEHGGEEDEIGIGILTLDWVFAT